MDDLISRKTLLDDLCEDREEGTFEFTDSQAEAANRIIVYVIERIMAQDSAPAVPFDPLCEWLADRYAVPCMKFDEPEELTCKSCYHPGKTNIECWKTYMEKMNQRFMEGKHEVE